MSYWYPFLMNEVVELNFTLIFSYNPRSATLRRSYPFVTETLNKLGLEEKTYINTEAVHDKPTAIMVISEELKAFTLRPETG